MSFFMKDEYKTNEESDHWEDHIDKTSLFDIIHNAQREIESDVLDDIEGWKEDIRQSKYGGLKLEALSAIPIAVGALVSGLARLTGHPEIIAIEPILPFTPFGAGLPVTGRGIRGYLFAELKYGFGAALPYIDVLLNVAKNYLEMK